MQVFSRIFVNRLRAQKITDKNNCDTQASTVVLSQREEDVSAHRYGISGADVIDRCSGVKKFRYLILYIISSVCGCQILVTKICNGGRICYALTNFIPNSSELNS